MDGESDCHRARRDRAGSRADDGVPFSITSDLPPAFAQRFSAGEPFDVIVSGSATIDEWSKAGRILPETRTDIARSGIGVEVKAGAAKPDISSVEAFKRALLAAKSIAFLRVGSGIHVAGLVDRLGIAEAIKAKVTRPESDIVSELVAKGEVAARHRRHHPDSDDARRGVRRSVAVRGAVVCHVHRCRQCDIEDARGGQATDYIFDRGDGEAGDAKAGDGASPVSVTALLVRACPRDNRGP